MKGKKLMVRCRLMPKGVCLNLFGTLWARDLGWIDRHVVNHERIHDAQQRELLWVPFYLLYVIEWLFRLIQYRDRRKAYYNISFEREAYAHGHDLSYLSQRRPYAWLRYLRRK